MPLLPSWTTLRDRLDKPLRQRLYNFMRYCSARRIDPESVNDGTLEGVLALPHRDDRTGVEQYRPALHGTDVECLRKRSRWLAAAAAHRATQKN